MQRSERCVHHSRDVEDATLGPQVQPVKWTPASLESFIQFFYKTAHIWDHVAASAEPAQVAQLVLAAAPTTYTLGEGGLVLFNPVVPSLQAYAHIYLWDPTYMRRPDLLRAVARFFMDKHALKRLTGSHVSTHRAASRLAESVGFHLEGTLRNAVVYSRGVGDLNLYGLLREDL